jgi:hypothetical protein
MCNKDPNLKTNVAADLDEMRILNNTNLRKLNIDSIIGTTHLIKKSVMLPVT